MTLKKWGYLFWTTLGIGSVAGVIIGIILKLWMKDFVFEGFPVGGYEWVFILLGAGLVASVSHVGLFAYLIMRFLGLSMLRSKFLWDILQSIMILIALFDLYYLRYTNFAGDMGKMSGYFFMPAILLVIALAVSYWKARLTNRGAWISTLFFMIVVTVLEAVPALRQNEMPFLIFVFGILLICNAWQILMLHKVLGNVAKKAETM